MHIAQNNMHGENMRITETLKNEFKLLGQRIQKLREERNISIKKLSEKTGIRKEYLKKIEIGNAYGIMLNAHIVKIAKVLNTDLSEIFDYK